MKRVIVESPYAGRGRWPFNVLDRWLNIRYARRCLRDSIYRGEAPFASHLLYTQRGVLRDSVFIERALGIAAGLEWGGVAELTVIYRDRGVTQGMVKGIERAASARRPIEYRRLSPSASNYTSWARALSTWRP